MKKIVLLFILTISTFSCEENEFKSDHNIEKIRDITSLDQDQFLSNTKENIKNQIKAGRVNSNLFQRINWNYSYRIKNHLSKTTTYTLPLLIKDKNQFENIVIIEKDNKAYPYIIRYEPSLNWIKFRSENDGFKYFSGDVSIVNLDNTIVSKSSYQNGKIVLKDNSNGRTLNCSNTSLFDWQVVCSSVIGCYTEITVTNIEICDNNYGSGSSENNDSNEPSGGGTSPSDPNEPTPIGPGDPAALDPVNISYYLFPLNGEDDINNPQDGMKAQDSYGVIYTYNADLDAWLLPEVQNLLENNGKLAFYGHNDLEPPKFDGQVLAAIAIVAVAEPTVVGEIVLGAATVGVAIIFVYKLADYAIESYMRDHLDHCQRLYARCDEEYRGYGHDCGSCLHYCRAQGEWDFLNCPFLD